MSLALEPDLQMSVCMLFLNISETCGIMVSVHALSIKIDTSKSRDNTNGICAWNDESG